MVSPYWPVWIVFALGILLPLTVALPQSYLDGLQQIAWHWPDLQNASLNSPPWTNFSSPCSFANVDCTSSGMSLTTAASWGEENTTLLPSLAPYFTSSWLLTISDLNVSAAAQTSLYINTLKYFSIQSAPITTMGDTSNLTILESFIANNLSALTTLPSFANSGLLTWIQVDNCNQLTTVEGWPTSTVRNWALRYIKFTTFLIKAIQISENAPIKARGSIFGPIDRLKAYIPSPAMGGVEARDNSEPGPYLPRGLHIAGGGGRYCQQA